ncbi:DHH family phosphoesterase [Clostridium sp.]|uniref:DHH family phosphoesterase n=1 Tax=Clostridium sp. TaxID=1506 RepID=UPI003F2B11B1
MKKKLKEIKSMITPLMFVLSCVAFYYINSVLLGTILLIIFILFTIIENSNSHNDEVIDNNEVKHVEELRINIDESVNQNVFNLVFPMAIINKTGEIIWSNKKFTEFTEENPIGLNVVSIARGLNIERLLACDEDLYQKIKIADSLYKVYASNIKQDENNVYLVYFNDISNLKNIENTKESIMLIEVDNLAEALDTTSESDRPMLVAEIEKSITAYAQKMKAMIMKYDSNKYILSVQDKYIDEEINSKFPILDSISNIDRGNKLEVTLSIGVGRGGASPQENQHFALTAKELSLGRGGDQVAVKNNEKISFFGGNSIEIEKRTRVRARVIAHALKELIYESSNVFIIGHITPDMDCFGSAVGLSSVVKQLGKPCNIIINNDISAIDYFLNRLKGDSKYNSLFVTSEQANEQLNEKSLLIIVDVHNRGYIQNLNIVEKVQRKIIIDHHRRSPDIIEGAILSYIEVYASSTSEMVTEIIQYMVQKPNINRIEAEGLLAGIYMDTKGFSFKAGVRTFDAASFLRGVGADITEVKKMFTDDLDDYLLIADTIKSANVEKGVAIAVSPERIKESFMVAKAADELLNISGIKACFVLGKINDDIIISGRSMGDTNVQVVLESLGGGGHMNMAGAKLINVTVEEAIEKLKVSIKKYLRIGE